MKHLQKLILIIICLMIFACQTKFVSQVFAEETVFAEELMTFLNELLPSNRTAGSEGETQSAFLLGEQLISRGITTKYEQIFNVNGAQTSKNVIGILPSVVQSSNIVIFGAHYDNIYSENSNGYGDNLSGVCSLLRTIDKLSGKNFEFNAWFVLFGAEEIGCLGSQHFASLLTNEEKENIFLFINFDSVGMGQSLFYSNGGSEPSYMNHIKRVNTDLNDAFELYSPNLSYPDNSSQTIGTLVFNSDMTALLNHCVNSVTFFAGTKTGFFEDWKENDDSNRIAHINDTKLTNETIFGDVFYSNIEKASEFAEKVVLSTDFLSYSLPNQTPTILYNSWALKGICVLIFLFCMVSGFWYLSKKNKLENNNPSYQ
ncbi:MAG: M28 family peptidase [Clostridia bacterium]